MEQANAKLIEGEEGASRTALEALNNYLSVRENGELEIEAAKKGIAIEVANLEKTIADYRFENEKKIAEIQQALCRERKGHGRRTAPSGGASARPCCPRRWRWFPRMEELATVSAPCPWIGTRSLPTTKQAVTQRELISHVLPVRGNSRTAGLRYPLNFSGAQDRRQAT
jgi:hypothetical protein